MTEQLCMFEDQKPQHDCCYLCEHFAEFKEPCTYADSQGEFIVHGVCMKGFFKNGSYTVYPVYVPGGVCKNFKKRKERKQGNDKL